MPAQRNALIDFYSVSELVAGVVCAFSFCRSPVSTPVAALAAAKPVLCIWRFSTAVRVPSTCHIHFAVCCRPVRLRYGRTETLDNLTDIFQRAFYATTLHLSPTPECIARRAHTTRVQKHFPAFCIGSARMSAKMRQSVTRLSYNMNNYSVCSVTR